MCTEAALQKELRDLSLCSAIPIPGYYEKTGKRYGIRKSKTYKGKPHDKTHVKVFKRKYKEDRGRVSKCKCYICGREGHFARDCRSKTGNIARRAVIDNLDLKEDWDIISADVSDQDTVYSISEGEGGATMLNIGSMIEDSPLEENAFIIQEEYCFMFHPESTEDIHKRKKVEVKRKEPDVTGTQADSILKLLIQKDNKWKQAIRDQAKEFYEWQVKEQEYKRQIREVEKLREENKSLIKDLGEVLKINEQMRNQIKALQQENEKIKGKQNERSLEEAFPRFEETLPSRFEEIFPLKQQINALIEDEVHTAKKTGEGEQTKVRKIINNQLYNVEVEFDIPNIKLFKVKAIIDTGATSCCINKSAVPIKAGNFIIEGNYALEMRTGDGIDMLIGTNFTRSMNGGIRIEGDEVTLYKKVTRLKTNQTTEVNTAAIEELDMDEEFYQELQETVFFSKQDSEKLKSRLDIINPDVTIEDKPLKHVTPALEASFQKHVDALLKLGVIRPSKSRHRTMAMMVNSGTTVDPATGKEIKGKERMVFNYRTLNDNTYKDQYSLPGINTLIQRIGTAKIYSKFDLKSGFHQVAMAEDSIEWTTFLVPKGLYEWLVMPFGLKNAPAIFQRKMDECFKGTEEFIAVYIYDILVFSKNEADHEKHLQVMLQICKKKGLVLSPTKMKIACSEVEFLGAIIGKDRIKLQPHIIKKICDFKEEKLKTKTGLRSFIGILNYARSYIPKLSSLIMK
ncbi:hypothetical protein L1987_11538 [Smallanthus sonchifolius]|uniref:Uncharacterized protein n=1 Tax=Smallanthus sonchifolius TaxID=185202 RepID=A0ACB9JBT4_9ASTR|nr:hypothetical protein L1987_11538 [Smallanthus sonchifolius]